MYSSFLQFLCFYLFFFYLFLNLTPALPLPSTNNLTFSGDAFLKNNSIILTRDSKCHSNSSSQSPHFNSSAFGFGTAFYAYPVRFLDTSNKTALSFSCSFSFSVIPSPSCPFGDGIAFLIISNASLFGLSDAFMGIPEIAQGSDKDLFFAVEFDTSYDANLGDINGDHVGVNVNNVKSLASVDVVSEGFDLKSGKEVTAWIEYRDTEEVVRVWVGFSEVRPQNPVLVCQIDLSKQFQEFMFVGFSAANGKGSATHVINQWWFKKSDGFVFSTLPRGMIEGGDCLYCFQGNDSRPVNYSRSYHQMDKRVMGIAIGFGCLSAIVISVCLAFFVVCVCLRRRKQVRGQNDGYICKYQRIKAPKRMSLNEIRSATKGFNANRIIGEGASAIVYEGSLPSCGTVAIKRFTQAKQTGSEPNPFSNEFDTMVGCLRHKNLVQLQGWCCEKGELVLAYEYMSNGSLDKILHKRTVATKFLTWDRRLNIVLGVASALIYLHEECERQIIHRDVKTCNIMLDCEFNAKLGDFGLAEVYDHSSRTRYATVPAGTMGYLAPEYVYSGVPTVKSDVYSFGVVVLEVASGRRPLDDGGTVITDWVWDLWEKGTLVEAADPKLMGRFHRVEMERMLMVGLSCVHTNHENRPLMRQAARMLRGEAPLPILPSRKPRMRIKSALPEGCEEVMKLGENLDGTPWSTPRSHFSRS